MIPQHPTPSAWVRNAFSMSLIMTLLGGCQFAPSKPNWPTSWFQKNDEPGTPDRMLAIWSDTILHQPGKPGVRGFGGRIYFYEGSDTKAILIDGKLSVYAYDGEDLGSSAKPLRKFVFTKEQFSEHMSYTDMGPSYSVWLPWDKVGGESMQLSLVTRFEGTAGGVVISKPTTKLLPGVARRRDLEPQPVTDEATLQLGDIRSESHSEIRQAFGIGTNPRDAKPMVRQASAIEESPTRRPSRSSEISTRGVVPRAESMTIDLPPSFQRHLITPDDPATETPPARTAPTRRGIDSRSPKGAETDPPAPYSRDSRDDNPDATTAVESDASRDDARNGAANRQTAVPDDGQEYAADADPQSPQGNAGDAPGFTTTVTHGTRGFRKYAHPKKTPAVAPLPSTIPDRRAGWLEPRPRTRIGD